MRFLRGYDGRENDASKYTSKIIKASALIPDTLALLAAWDCSLSTEENLKEVTTSNTMGKASRSRVEDILAIFHQRYLGDQSVVKALVTLLRAGFDTASLRPILYYLSAKSDALLHDSVTEILVPQWESGRTEVMLEDVIKAVSGWVDEGKTAGMWSPATVRRVSEGVMATLRDFGVLQGVRRKSISQPFLEPRSFAFIAYDMSRLSGNGEKLLVHPDWRLFFLSKSDAEKHFLECHQRRLLEYSALGRVVRIEFGSSTLEEYADALARRSYCSIGD